MLISYTPLILEPLFVLVCIQLLIVLVHHELDAYKKDKLTNSLFLAFLHNKIATRNCICEYAVKL